MMSHPGLALAPSGMQSVAGLANVASDHVAPPRWDLGPPLAQRPITRGNFLSISARCLRRCEATAPLKPPCTASRYTDTARLRRCEATAPLKHQQKRWR